MVYRNDHCTTDRAVGYYMLHDILRVQTLTCISPSDAGAGWGFLPRRPILDLLRRKGRLPVNESISMDVLMCVEGTYSDGEDDGSGESQSGKKPWLMSEDFCNVYSCSPVATDSQCFLVHFAYVEAAPWENSSLATGLRSCLTDLIFSARSSDFAASPLYMARTRSSTACRLRCKNCSAAPM